MEEKRIAEIERFYHGAPDNHQFRLTQQERKDFLTLCALARRALEQNAAERMDSEHTLQPEAASVSAAPSASELPPLACLDCGKPYRDFLLDLTLPDEQWRMIHDSEGGLLCASCMVTRAARLPGAIAVRMRIEFADDVPAAPEATPQPSTANNLATAPSPEGVGQGEVAEAAPSNKPPPNEPKSR